MEASLLHDFFSLKVSSNCKHKLTGKKDFLIHWQCLGIGRKCHVVHNMTEAQTISGKACRDVEHDAHTHVPEGDIQQTHASSPPYDT